MIITEGDLGEKIFIHRDAVGMDIFRWFLKTYPTRDVEYTDLMLRLRKDGRIRWIEWVHDNFPQNEVNLDVMKDFIAARSALYDHVGIRHGDDLFQSVEDFAIEDYTRAFWTLLDDNITFHEDESYNYHCFRLPLFQGKKIFRGEKFSMGLINVRRPWEMVNNFRLAIFSNENERPHHDSDISDVRRV